MNKMHFHKSTRELWRCYRKHSTVACSNLQKTHTHVVPWDKNVLISIWSVDRSKLRVDEESLLLLIFALASDGSSNYIVFIYFTFHEMSKLVRGWGDSDLGNWTSVLKWTQRAPSLLHRSCISSHTELGLVLSQLAALCAMASLRTSVGESI